MWLILDIYYLLQNAFSQKILFAGIHHYNPRCTAAAALRGRGRLLLVAGLGHVDARCRHRLQHRQVWASQLLGQRAGVVMGTRFPSISICNDIFQAGRYNNIIWYRSEWNLDKTRYWINLSTWIYLRLRVYWPLTWQGFSRGDVMTNVSPITIDMHYHFNETMKTFNSLFLISQTEAPWHPCIFSHLISHVANKIPH